MNSIDNLKWRYAVKKFDHHKILSDHQINILKQAFNLTDVGECKNVIGKCGFVFEPGNFRELSNIIYNALKNKSRMMDIAKCFSSKVKENYGPENFKRKYFRLLNL